MRKKSYKNKLETKFSEWILQSHVNVAITYTFKQGLSIGNGQFEPISDEEIIRTMWLLRDRTTKKILGTRKFKDGYRLPFVVFKEGDGKSIRHHVHIAATKPTDMPLDEYRMIHNKCCENLRWVHQISRFEETYDSEGWVKYCSSYDLSTYLPQSSEHHSFIIKKDSLLAL